LRKLIHIRIWNKFWEGKIIRDLFFTKNIRRDYDRCSITKTRYSYFLTIITFSRKEERVYFICIRKRMSGSSLHQGELFAATLFLPFHFIIVNNVRCNFHWILKYYSTFETLIKFFLSITAIREQAYRAKPFSGANEQEILLLHENSGSI